MDAGSSFAPKSSAVAVRIPKDSGGELRFPDQSFGVKLPGADGQAAVLSSNNAFFANVVHDGDLVLQPRPNGAEISVTLRSPAAPTTIPLRFDLSGDQRLSRVDARDDEAPQGSVEIADGRDRIALVYPALAFDASGEPVPVTDRVEGDRLVVQVDTNANPMYPIMVDPPIGVYDLNGGGAGSGSAGFTWPNWDVSTYAEAPNTTTTTYSYCNNQSTYPNKKFYFCQGSLTGASWTGGPVFVKPNFNQTYSSGDWAQWVKQARTDAYIYRFDTSGMYNVSGNQAHLAVGVRTAAGTEWEWGSVLWGNGIDTSQGDASPAGSAAYRTPMGTALVDSTRYMYVHNSSQQGQTAPADPITPNNKAVIRMIMEGGTPSGTLPYVQVGSAATLSSELYAPTLAAPTHSNAVPSGWVDSYSDTVSATATDRGLGMGKVVASGPGLSATATACATPASGNAQNKYDGCALTLALPSTSYTAPEGTDNYTISATDLVTNRSTAQDKSWTVKVDKTPPSSLSTSGGTLTGTDGQALNGSYTLNFSATDSLSGVKQAKFYVDDMNTPAQTRTQSTTCGTAGCPQTLTGQFTFNTDARNADGSYQYSEGVHTLKIAAEDPLAPTANHTTSKTWTVIIDRTNPTAPVSGDGYDLRTDQGKWLAADDYEVNVDPVETGSGVASVSLSVDGTVVDSDSSNCPDVSCDSGYLVSYDTSSLAAGSHSVQVKVTDRAGNVGTQTWDVRVDGGAPTVSASGALRTAEGQQLTGSSYPLSVSSSDSVSGATEITVSVDSQRVYDTGVQACPAGACSVNGSWTYSTTTFGTGTHEIRVVATDAAGNTAETSWTVAPTTDPVSGCTTANPPTVTSAGSTAVSTTTAASSLSAADANALAASQPTTITTQTVSPTLQPTSSTTLSSSSTLTSSDVGKNAGDGVSVGSGSNAVCLKPAALASESTSASMQGDSALYANTATATDTVIRPAAMGVETLTQIRSASAPDTTTWTVQLDSGEELRALSNGQVAVVKLGIDPSTDEETADTSIHNTDLNDPIASDLENLETDGAAVTQATAASAGSIQSARDQVTMATNNIALAQGLVHDGKVIAAFGLPWAHDAAGTSVPASLSVNGSRVTLTVSHHAGTYAYPIVADPPLAAAPKGYVATGGAMAAMPSSQLVYTTGDRKAGGACGFQSPGGTIPSGQSVAYNGIAFNPSTCTWLGQTGTAPLPFLRTEETSVSNDLATAPADSNTAGSQLSAARSYPKGHGWFKIWWEDPVDIDVAGARVAVAYHYGGGCIHHSYAMRHSEVAANITGLTHWHVVTLHWYRDAHCGQIYSSTYAKIKNTYFALDCSKPVYAHISRTNIHVKYDNDGYWHPFRAWLTGDNCRGRLGLHYTGWVPPSTEVQDPGN